MKTREKRSWQRSAQAVIMAAACVVFAGCEVVGDEELGRTVSETPRLFPEADYLWTPIPDDPAIDPASSGIIDDLTSRPDPASALLADYAIPVFTASKDDLSFPIECRDERQEPCQPSELDAIRIPAGATPNNGSDRAMVVVDLVDGVTYELWRAVDNGDTWSVQWGSVNSLGGDGTTTSGGSGSGLSRLVGIIRSEELRREEINHALALASNATCADEFREPAWSTDGSSDGENCIPMGSRLQLDPSVDLSTLELTDGERVIAEALQRYGGYVVDSSASPLAIFFEYEPSASDPDDLGPTAKALGFRWDYDSLPGIPWDHLRVLLTWSGGLDNFEAPPTYAE